MNESPLAAFAATVLLFGWFIGLIFLVGLMAPLP